MPAQVWPAVGERGPRRSRRPRARRWRRRARSSDPCRPARARCPSGARRSPRRRGGPTSTEPVKKIFAALDSTQRVLPTRAAAVDGAHEPLRDAGALEHPLDALGRSAAVSDAGLSTTPLPHNQRDGDLAERDRPRVIPGRDHADDAERLVGDPGTSSASRRAAGRRASRPRGRPGPFVGDPVEAVDRRQQLHRVGLDARLALLAREQLGQRVEVRR